MLVGNDQPIGVAVERDPDIGAPRQHLATHLLGHQRPAFAVDVEPVRRHPEREDFGAQFPEYRRRHLVAGAVSAIDDDAQAVEPQPAREALLDELDVAAAGVVEPLDPAEFGGNRAPARPAAEAGFDPLLEFIRQFVAVAPEELDAVVAVRVVRGRQHDADIGAQAARQHRDRRGRQRPDQHHVHAHRDKSGGQRRFEHVPREAGILADDDEMLVRAVLEGFADRHRDFERGFRRHRFGVRSPTDPVSAEELAHRGDPRPVEVSPRQYNSSKTWRGVKRLFC